MSYHKSTYASSNPLIRMSHQKRLENSLSAIEITPALRLLDFGCGDGLFLSELANLHDCRDRIVGFEPFMPTLDGVEVEILQQWDEVEARFQGDNKANYVTCFEVLEHFTAEAQSEALRKMASVLSKDGTLIVSVPIECGPPAFPKNFFRWLKFRRKLPHIYNFRNISRSVLGQPIPECRTGKEYLSHMGFYFRDLEEVMKRQFEIVDRRCSPFGALGPYLNSQVFYQLKRRL